MEMLSERYGWTPNQIRDISLSDIENYLDIISLKNKNDKENSRRKKY